MKNTIEHRVLYLLLTGHRSPEVICYLLDITEEEYENALIKLEYEGYMKQETTH